MKVRDIMSISVVTIDEFAPYKEIAETLVAYDVSGAPVVDVDGHVLGVVTESDLLAKEAYPKYEERRLARLAKILVGEPQHVRKAAALNAADLMTKPAIVVGPDASVREAARIMFDHGIKRLPVVEGEQVVGMLSRHDVMRVFVREDDDLRRTVEDFLRRALFVPPEHEVGVVVDRGIVVLSGTVEYASDARVVAALVETIDGVVEVDNQLGFRSEDPPPRSAKPPGSIRVG